MSLKSVVPVNVTSVATQPTAAVDPAKANQNKPSATKTPPPPPPPPKHDTVNLSASAQAKALKQVGKTPAQIAYLLNTDVKTVDGYLGIQALATSTRAVKPLAATTPAAKMNLKV